MPFNQQEQEIIQFGKEQGKNKQDIINAISKFRSSPQQPQQQSRFQETLGDIKQTSQNIASRFTGGADKIAEIQEAQRGGQGLGSTALQTFGAGAGAVSQSVGDLITGVVKGTLSQEDEQKVKNTVSNVATKVMTNPAVGWTTKQYIKSYQESTPETQRNLEGIFNIAMLGLDVAGAGFGKKAAGTGIKAGREVLEGGLEQGLKIGSEVVESAGKATTKTASRAIKGLKPPKPSAIEAVGQVLQGKTKDIAGGVKAFSKLDTSSVKTFKELRDKITDKIVVLSRQVDDDLGKDAAKKALKDLTISAKTTSGKIVKTNPVKIALNQLDELYTKIGDVIESANIKELIKDASKNGLTKLEINNLARKYGQEFGEKAFSKLGDPLTSVNAKLFEGTRKRLKELARQGIKGGDAKLADEAMSNLYNTKRLIQKNIEAVNKIQQKIQERGILEKVGHGISKYANVLSGGSLKGIFAGITGSNVGLKTLNSLDIERLLSRNLKIIQDAIESKSDDQIINILKKLNSKN